MSITSQNLLTNPPSRISFYFLTPHLENPSFCLSPHLKILKFQSLNKSFYTRHAPLRAFQLDSKTTLNNKQEHILDNFLDLDAFLSIAEILCFASSGVISIGYILNSQKPIWVGLGSKVSVLQFLLLVGGMMIGSVIRRRQWRRICFDSSKPGVNLVDLIEKLEEDVRSSVAVVRLMSRQLENLWIQFRVTRKALKEPIAEAAALAQKNSEASRALAVQEDILEKELREIQNFLLAMQVQQQKQLELILAIGKSGKLWESKQAPSQDLDKVETFNSGPEGVKQMSTKRDQQ